MIPSLPAAALYGALCGALIGWASRLVLKRFIKSSDKAFYAAFVAGFFVRLGLLGAAVCLLRHEKYIIIAAFAACMILVQTAFEAFPVRHGPETDT